MTSLALGLGAPLATGAPALDVAFGLVVATNLGAVIAFGQRSEA